MLSLEAFDMQKIHASGGYVGSVDHFLVDGEHWAISRLAVDTGKWYCAGRY